MSNDKNELLIEAQNYGLKHKLKNFSPKGIQRAVTEFGSSKYKERMDTLREADDNMRETAVLFKGYLSNAEKAFNDNRYLDVAHWCAMVNDGIKLMMKDAQFVKDLQDQEIAEYYTRHEDANPEANYFSSDDGLIATAGFFDRLFGNSIEKIYWKKIRESKLAVQSLVKRTERLIAIVNSSLDRMGNARAQGDIGAWLEDLKRIGKAQDEFQVFARGIYDKYLKELADIINAGKQKPSNYTLEVDKTQKPEEAVELVSNKDEKKVIEDVKKTDKFEKGRPALNDPRNVKKKQNKELEQLDQLKNLLNNPLTENKVVAPEVPVVEQIKEPEVKETVKNVEPSVIETKEQNISSSPVIPVEELKNESVQEVKPAEIPKQEISKPVEIKQEPVKSINVLPEKPIETPKLPDIQPNIVNLQNTSNIPKAPEQTTVNESPKRGRGRPRKYPRPEEINQSTNIPVQNDINVPTSIPKSNLAPIQSPIENTVPAKDSPVHVDIKGKTPEKDNIEEESRNENPLNAFRSLIKTPESAKIENSKKDVILIVIPKNISSKEINEIKNKLEKDTGKIVYSVTKDNGKEFVKSLINSGFKQENIVGLTYDEAKTEADKVSKADPLTLLDDPEFLKTLPLLGNGDYHKGMIFDEDDFPAFKNLDKKTKKSVIDKLNKLDEEKQLNSKNENKSISPEIKLEPTKEIKTPEVKTPEVKLPEVSKELEQKKNKLTDEDIEKMVNDHVGLIEKIIGKSITDIDSKDIFKLLENKDYMDSLPRSSNKKEFDYKLIEAYPEIQILKKFVEDGGYNPVRLFISTLKGIESKKIPYPRAKAASVEEILIKKSHNNFFKELQKVAKTENIGLMATMMCKYSEYIENIDPEMSIRLLIQAEKLIA